MKKHHLYMPHLFTHYLPTIICVMLMSIALNYTHNVCHTCINVVKKNTYQYQYSVTDQDCQAQMNKKC